MNHQLDVKKFTNSKGIKFIHHGTLAKVLNDVSVKFANMTDQYLYRIKCLIQNKIRMLYPPKSPIVHRDVRRAQTDSLSIWNFQYINNGFCIDFICGYAKRTSRTPFSHPTDFSDTLYLNINTTLAIFFDILNRDVHIWGKVWGKFDLFQSN